MDVADIFDEVNEDLRAELREGVGDGEPGHRQTEDGDAQSAPVRIPAAQGVEVAGARHSADSHST